jgi:hypothetical protein
MRMRSYTHASLRPQMRTRFHRTHIHVHTVSRTGAIARSYPQRNKSNTKETNVKFCILSCCQHEFEVRVADAILDERTNGQGGVEVGQQIRLLGITRFIGELHNTGLICKNLHSSSRCTYLVKSSPNFMDVAATTVCQDCIQRLVEGAKQAPRRLLVGAGGELFISLLLLFPCRIDRPIYLSYLRRQTHRFSWTPLINTTTHTHKHTHTHTRTHTSRTVTHRPRLVC